MELPQHQLDAGTLGRAYAIAWLVLLAAIGALALVLRRRKK